MKNWFMNNREYLRNIGVIFAWLIGVALLIRYCNDDPRLVKVGECDYVVYGYAITHHGSCSLCFGKGEFENEGH